MYAGSVFEDSVTLSASQLSDSDLDRENLLLGPADRVSFVVDEV